MLGIVAQKCLTCRLKTIHLNFYFSFITCHHHTCGCGFSGFGSKIKYSTVNSYIMLTLTVVLTEHPKTRVHLKFILFCHYSDYANTKNTLWSLNNSIRNDGQREFFFFPFLPLNYLLSSWVLWIGMSGRWAWWWWNIHKLKILCIMNSKYISLPFFYISHVCSAVL